MKRRLFKMALLVLCLVFATNAFAAKYNGNIQINVNGKQRTYKLYVPNNVLDSAPLVLSLHGTGGSCEWGHPEFNSLADKNGFIVAYPSGGNVYYPEFGMSMSGWQATGQLSEDTDFFLAIIEDVNSRYLVDRQRIYCCGFSNGGMMTYTVASTLRDTFAAFASIAGFPIESMHLHQSSAKPFPFLHIHGTTDNLVVYSKLPVIVDNVIARNGCNPVPTVENVTSKGKKSVYAATEGSFPYILYEISGMGHESDTNATEDGNSALTMWNFMSQYRLDDECDATLEWRPNIEQEDYKPTSHGWKMNNGDILLSYATEQKNSSNKNIYRSLQLETGNHRLSLHAATSGEQVIGVKLQKLNGDKSVVLDKTVTVGEDTDVALDFTTEGGWAEYHFEITRQDTEAEIAISKIEIHTVADPLGIANTTTVRQGNGAAYDLGGRRVSPDSKGIIIIDGKKMMKN